MVLLCSKCGDSPTTALPAIGVPPMPPGASSPDLARLLTSTEAPLDSEIRAVRAIVVDGQQQIDALDAQITGVRAKLAQLVHRRDETAERVRRHRAILAPLRRVPMELLCEIFAMTLPGDDTAGKPPWYLGHICRSWRFAALGYPSLWNSITIPNSRYSMLPMIETQLLRSANAPLTVHWSTTKKSAPMDPHSHDAVLAHCNRWATLHLNVKGTTANLQWLRPVAGRLTALRKFDLTSPASLEIPEIFSGASGLREIYVSGQTFHHYSPDIVVPWTQITHFRGVYRTDIQRSILSAAPNLLECTIYFDEDLGAHTAITTPCLRRLCINRATRLSHLTAALLEELFVVCNSPMAGLLHFVHRSSCLLKTLVLLECTISSDLIAVLRDLPSLTYILIEEHDENDATDVSDLFEAMTITGTSRDMCPNLTNIIFGAGPRFPCHIFCTMARSRFQSNPPKSRSERVRLFNYSASKPGDWSESKVQIQRLRNEGFDAATLTTSQVRLLHTNSFIFNTI
ncbi:hypothetical protein DFH06DRAFT_1483408 [Mycena polygramma]|nr:hypothetical protein DFH06DRAFT_1483408 [Mycena polygramma]